MNPCPFCSASLRTYSARPSGAALLTCRQCLNPALAEPNANGLQVTALAGYEDLRYRVQPGSVMEGMLHLLNKEINNLPVLPEAPRRVMAMVHDPIASTADVAGVLNEDPVLSAQVFKMANSAFYGGVEPIRELHVACARIGMRGVANVVQASAQSNLYKSKEAKFRQMIHDLWRHSVATAHATKLLAEESPALCPEQAFFAGLIHDIGKVLLLDLIAEKYTGPKGELRDSPELLARVIDAFHPLVGLHLTDRWNLPPEYGFTTFYSGAPENCPIEEWTPLTHAVCLGGRISEVCGFGGAPSDNGGLDGHASIGHLQLDDATIAAVLQDVPEAVEELLDIIEPV